MVLTSISVVTLLRTSGVLELEAIMGGVKRVILRNNSAQCIQRNSTKRSVIALNVYAAEFEEVCRNTNEVPRHTMLWVGTHPDHGRKTHWSLAEDTNIASGGIVPMTAISCCRKPIQRTIQTGVIDRESDANSQLILALSPPQLSPISTSS